MSERWPRRSKEDLEDEDEAEESQPTRRGAFGILAGGAVVAGMVAAGLHKPGEEKTAPAENSADAEPASWEAAPESFPLGDLAGRPVSGFYADYLGAADGPLPETLAIDYSRVLASLQNKKIAHWSEKMRAAGKTLDDSILEIAADRIALYANRWNDREEFPSRAEAIGRTALPDFISAIGDRLREAQNALSAPEALRALQRAYDAPPERLNVVAELFNRMSSRTLMAYSMTELMPGSDGLFNAAFYDFLLRTGGKEFVANIPSQGDGEPSIGPFQFTPRAINDTRHLPRERRTAVGASIVNRALPPELQIPDTLDDLYNIEDHFIAAFLFSVNNLIHAAERMPASELGRFGALDFETLVEFIATSHNNPAAAAAILRAYLAPHARGKKHAVSYRECCRLLDARRDSAVSMAEYALKTERNSRGLEEFLASRA